MGKLGGDTIRRMVVSVMVVICLGLAGCQSTVDRLDESQSIAEEVTIQSMDTVISMQIRGGDINRPIMLYLHGGPADHLDLLGFQTYVGRQLEKKFIMVYLHQRGVLNSPAVEDRTHTVSIYIEDVRNAVDFLQSRFSSRRIYLMGHSWGGILGYLYLLKYPDDVNRLVAVSAPFSMRDNLVESYRMTWQWAREVGNRDALADLERLQFPYCSTLSDTLTVGRWSSVAYGGRLRNMDISRILRDRGMDKPDPAWQAFQLRVIELMHHELFQLNVEERVRDLHTPLLLIAGRQDTDVPIAGLKEGFNNYGGAKTLLVYDNCHHLPFVDQPDRFVRDVVAFCLPGNTSDGTRGRPVLQQDEM